MTQKEKVLAHLKRAKLTQLEATLEYGILRLGAIVNVLRKEGYEIITHTPEGNGNYAIYELLGTKKKPQEKEEKIEQADLGFDCKKKFKGYWEE